MNGPSPVGFSWALAWLHDNRKVRREHWPKGKYLALNASRTGFLMYRDGRLWGIKTIPVSDVLNRDWEVLS